MALDLDAVGFEAEPFTVSWTAEDAILYALGVGAGHTDPLAELSLTTQNTAGVDQQVLPTYGIVLGQSGLLRRIPIGDFDKSKLLHADQRIELQGTVPTAGSATIRARLDGIYAKRSGALVVVSAQATDATDGEPMWKSTLGYFVRGEGGFEGQAPPRDDWIDPHGEPDLVLTASTRPDQALLYRLSGDFNPLHSDPTFAARAGFDLPILHGLCTYGVVHRVLLGGLCGGDTSGFGSMYARFSRPVRPGETLRTHLWHNDTGASFTTTNEAGVIVLDRGRFVFDQA